MSNQQKSALYLLVVALAALIAAGVLLIAAGPAVAPAGFAVFALGGLAPVLFPERQRDERERHLARRAAVGGGLASYLFIVITCMGIWFLRFRRDDPQIDVAILPVIVMGAASVLVIVRSAALLVLARRPLELGE